MCTLHAILHFLNIEVCWVKKAMKAERKRERGSERIPVSKKNTTYHFESLLYCNCVYSVLTCTFVCGEFKRLLVELIVRDYYYSTTLFAFVSLCCFCYLPERKKNSLLLAEYLQTKPDQRFLAQFLSKLSFPKMLTGLCGWLAIFIKCDINTFILL